ncbi:OB-fold domain-containing protein [Achromobacter denitrificans]
MLGPGSGSPALEWRLSAGLGTVHAVTVVHPRDQDTYNVVLIDLDEGFRLMSRVKGRPAIGMRVRMRAHSRRPTAARPIPSSISEEPA